MDSDDPENYLRLAEIYRQMKQLDKAEQNVLLAKQRAPGNLEVTYYEASIYQDEGRIDDSIRVLSDAVTRVKTAIRIHSFAPPHAGDSLPATGAVVSRSEQLHRGGEHF